MNIAQAFQKEKELYAYLYGLSNRMWAYTWTNSRGQPFVEYLDTPTNKYRTHEQVWAEVIKYPREFGVQHFPQYLDKPYWKTLDNGDT